MSKLMLTNQHLVAISILTLLVGCQEKHLACQIIES